jgi:zona occludens toxin (predicted ATPase)
MKIKYEEENIYLFIYLFIYLLLLLLLLLLLFLFFLRIKFLRIFTKNDNFSGEGSSNHQQTIQVRRSRFKPSPATAPI